MRLGQNSNATAQPVVSGKKIYPLLIPLPPLEEQHRIVAKIEELLPYVDRYAASWEKLEHFNAKFPEDMRKSILQYAIQGKLVEQRPEEGTAEELYQQIQKNKSQRLNGKKDGKLSPEKFKENEIPFDIPENWKWVRFGHIMINRDAERIPLSVSERQKLEKKYDYYGASGVIDKVDKFLFNEKLLLIGEDGANLLSRSTPIAYIVEGEYWVNNHAHVLDCDKELVCMEYIMHYINAITLAPYVTGTAQPKMNQEKMNSIPIALPPYREQQRIVAKIEELLPYCDRLIEK
jgi:type I restriction enzyme S subunit